MFMLLHLKFLKQKNIIFLMRSDSSLSLALEIPIHRPTSRLRSRFSYNFLPQPSLQIKMME